MNKKEAMEQLRDLILDRESFVNEADKDCVFKKDIEALEIAVKVLQNQENKTAKEMFEEIKENEDAFEIIVSYGKGYGEFIDIILKYPDDMKIVNWDNFNIELTGRFDFDSLILIYKAINKQVEELGW